MERIKVTSKLSAEERETILNYDSETRVWTMDTTIPKHFRKALKQDWTPIIEYVYEDGSVCGMVLTASEKAVTLRNPNKKRVMSEKQMGNLHKHDGEEDDDE